MFFYSARDQTAGSRQGSEDHENFPGPVVSDPSTGSDS